MKLTIIAIALLAVSLTACIGDPLGIVAVSALLPGD